MQAFFFISILFMLITSGGEDLFKLDEIDTEDESGIKEQSVTVRENYSLKDLVKCNFDGKTKTGIAILYTLVDFANPSQNKFQIIFGEISNDEIALHDVGHDYSFDGSPIQIESGDLNGDGIDEVVLYYTDNESKRFIVQLAPCISDVVYPTISIPDDRRVEIALADMDGDGVQEIVAPSFRTDLSPVDAIDKVIVYFMNEDSIRQESYAILPAPVLAVTVDDTDDDGLDEIITLRKIEGSREKNAIWSIMRREDGTYAERPIATGESLSLAPQMKNSNYLYYVKRTKLAGQYFNDIVGYKFEGDNFERVSECRIYPQGNVLSMVWGHFVSPDDLSLALITDESLISRRWLTIYTPMENGIQKNIVNIVSSDDFHPVNRNPIVVDIDGDSIDELIYLGIGGKIIACDAIRGTGKIINIRHY